MSIFTVQQSHKTKCSARSKDTKKRNKAENMKNILPEKRIKQDLINLRQRRIKALFVYK